MSYCCLYLRCYFDLVYILLGTLLIKLRIYVPRTCGRNLARKHIAPAPFIFPSWRPQKLSSSRRSLQHQSLLIRGRCSNFGSSTNYCFRLSPIFQEVPISGPVRGSVCRPSSSSSWCWWNVRDLRYWHGRATAGRMCVLAWRDKTSRWRWFSGSSACWRREVLLLASISLRRRGGGFLVGYRFLVLMILVVGCDEKLFDHLPTAGHDVGRRELPRIPAEGHLPERGHVRWCRIPGKHTNHQIWLKTFPAVETFGSNIQSGWVK